MVRLRGFFWLVLTSLILFAIRDLLTRPAWLGWLLAIKVVQLTLAASFPRILRPERVTGREPGVAVATLATYCACVAVAGVLCGDASGTVLSFMAILLGTAVVVEWGVVAQACLAAVALALWAANTVVVDGPHGMLDPMGAGMVVGAAASIYMANVMTRMQRAIDERGAALAESARLARETERARRRSEEYFRALIDNAADLIAVLDAGGAIRYVSPSVERLLGLQPAEWIGRSAFDLIHPDDRRSRSSMPSSRRMAR
jgi:PAS domain-containing protein